MKLITIFCCLMCLQHLAVAQYNDSTHYFASYASTGTINKTDNSDSYMLNNAMQLGISKKLVSSNLSGSWMYGEQQKVLTNNDLTAALDVNLYMGFPHFYYWGLATYTSSFSLKINNQYQAGAGVAYNIIDKKETKINISDGIVYDNSDVYLDDTVRDIYDTYRNSFRLMIRYTYKDLITFNGTGFLQNSFKMKSDYIIKADMSLSVKLYKFISVTAAFTYNRFNRTDKENLLFSYGLTVAKYF